MRNRIFWAVLTLLVAAAVMLMLPVSTDQVESADEPIVAQTDPGEDPQESEKIETAVKEQSVALEVCLTAYCACTYCCGEWADGITATGVKAQANHTIAVDPDVIPLGSWVLIGEDWYRAEDTGAFCGNIVDIYFDDHEEAKAFGRRTAVVYVDVKERE